MTQVIVKSSTSNVKNLLGAALANELRVLKIGVEKTSRRLCRLEKEFGMESQRFYQEFQTGKMGDSLEHIKWAGEYETLLQLQQDYDALRGVRLC